MFVGPTDDYNRVESSTGTEDGSRVVIILARDAEQTSISLPAIEVPRLILAISTAAAMARSARGELSPTPLLPTKSLRFGPDELSDRVQFFVELHGGAEMAFQIDRRTATEFMHDWIQALRRGNPANTD